jgi:hypothetical protein
VDSAFGCQPKDFVSHNVQIRRFGAVAYDKELSEKEMKQYELEPVRMEDDE